MKSSGVSVRPPLFSTVFFEEQGCVDLTMTFQEFHVYISIIYTRGVTNFLLAMDSRFSAMVAFVDMNFHEDLEVNRLCARLNYS